MMYLSDRRRIECAILPRLLLGIANDGGFRAYADDGTVIDEGEAELVERLKVALTEACREPLDGLSSAEAAKVARRIDRLAVAVFDTWRGEPAAKWAIAVMMVTRDIHDSGYMRIITGSAMHRAYELFAPMLDDAMGHDLIVKSAEKQARHLLRDLSARYGLFNEMRDAA